VTISSTRRDVCCRCRMLEAIDSLARPVSPRAWLREIASHVHVGAVPSPASAACGPVRKIIRPPSGATTGRLYENPQAFNWGIVILYSIETAEPLALLHEFQLSGMRVGATTAVAVDQIARPDAHYARLVRDGKQARSALEAIAVVRPLRRINVYSPSAEHAGLSPVRWHVPAWMWWRLPTPGRWSPAPTSYAAPLPR